MALLGMTGVGIYSLRSLGGQLKTGH